MQKVVDASAEGWAACVAGDFHDAKRDILAAAPSTPPDLFDYSMKIMNDNAMAGAGREIGAMTDARWKDLSDEMRAVGVLPEGLDYKAAYTLAFVDKLHAQ